MTNIFFIKILIKKIFPQFVIEFIKKKFCNCEFQYIVLKSFLLIMTYPNANK